MSTNAVRPNVPAPDTYNGSPATLKQWLFGVELYLTACRLDKDNVDSEYCCSLVASLLRGNALAWYRLACLRNPASIPKKWVDLRTALLKQFGVIEENRNARDKLRDCKQQRSVLQYMESFQALAMSIDDASDAELLHSFVWGLKERVRAEVRLRNPKTFDEAARLALDFDELLRPAKSWGQQTNWSKGQHSSAVTGAGSNGPQPMVLGNAQVQRRNNGRNGGYQQANRQRGGYAPAGNSGPPNRQRDLSRVKCFKCGQFGHYKRDCQVRRTAAFSAVQVQQNAPCAEHPLPAQIPATDCTTITASSVQKN